MKQIILTSLFLVIFSNILKSQNKDSSNLKLKTLDVKSKMDDYCNCEVHITLVIDSSKMILQKSFSYSKLTNIHINKPYLKNEILTNDSLIISYIVPGFHISLNPDYSISDGNYINFDYFNESKVDSFGEVFEINYIFSWPTKYYKFPIIKYQNKIIDKLK